MKYYIDDQKREIINIDGDVSTIRKLEYKVNESVIHLTNGHEIHLKSEDYGHQRIKEYDDKELDHLIIKYRGDLLIDKSELKELRRLEEELHNSTFC